MGKTGIPGNGIWGVWEKAPKLGCWKPFPFGPPPKFMFEVWLKSGDVCEFADEVFESTVGAARTSTHQRATQFCDNMGSSYANRTTQTSAFALGSLRLLVRHSKTTKNVDGLEQGLPSYLYCGTSAPVFWCQFQRVQLAGEE